ncbi:MAG: DNA mismatch repair endonuclease MutL, partial [Lachnospiraceae bacterium]|nr:DNA mismatch repair endonuclease MutL [Lachnospiraceae bacterium]
MSEIHVLDQKTIDKIAAGEVIERPASIVKELVENSIDAGATSITVEIIDGGKESIRITDNGRGIPKSQISTAFLRHATSKITDASDLFAIHSLGFRGEALSSIAAVSRVSVITKTKEDEYGTEYNILGGTEKDISDIGANDGTIFDVEDLFFNVPVRKKFLKSGMTEYNHISDIITRLALSNPNTSFKLISNNSVKLETSGNGKLDDVIYNIYGKEIYENLLYVDKNINDIHIEGYIGKPVISRGNRNFETLFVNGRYIKNGIIEKGIEDAYKDFSMQHRYPFCVLNIYINPETVDVNVHPTKMEVRFSKQVNIYNIVYEIVNKALSKREDIEEVVLENKEVEYKKDNDKEPKSNKIIPELTNIPYKSNSDGNTVLSKDEEDNTVSKVFTNYPQKTNEPNNDGGVLSGLDYFMDEMRKRVLSYHQEKVKEENEVKDEKSLDKDEDIFEEKEEIPNNNILNNEEEVSSLNKEVDLDKYREGVQETLFEDTLLKKENLVEYKFIGQLFKTYWLIEFKDQLYIIDQHAAHERILYEKTLNSMKTREYISQYLSPPIVLTLTISEEQVLNEFKNVFTRIGFEIEDYGPRTYAITAIPDNLFGISKKELFIEMLDLLSDEIDRNLSPDLIDEKIASLSCKAAVKGNMNVSEEEMKTIISGLITLDNPYHCPHGRPTI